ncbi:MAG: hypothetical protein E6Q06_01485 [Candidatus Moraniibacteriota bacterium]|nr:MAG: hypothetical protein E6Q06_01485 [Candidatus Moranbacteria bacterium]
MQWNTLSATLKHWSERRENLIASIVVLAGLFFGSLFVDVVQIFTGSGFSRPAIQSHDILVTGGKTWVGYTEPKVPLQVISDVSCATCDPSEALLWLRRIVPTIEAERIDISSDAGKRAIEAFRLTTVPAFVFSGAVKATEFYAQAEPLFHEEQGMLVFDVNKIGMPIGRYLVAPETGDDDIVLGSRDAPVTLVVFSDFQCQYCREYHEAYKRLLSEYGDRVRIVWKHFPLPIHREAPRAAEAAQCAAAQGHFMAYADILFGKQSEWGKPGGERRFKEYAWRVRDLDARAFGRCIDEKQSAEKVSLDIGLAEDFFIESAPATFVNREFVSGAAPYADLKTLVDTALAE